MTSEKTNTKPILITLLLVTSLLLVPFGMENAFAEVSDELRQKALDGKLIWEKIEQIKSGNGKGIVDDDASITELEKEFNSIVEIMNANGIATQEQWDANSDYWRMKNVPNMVQSSHNSDRTMSFPNGNSNTGIETMSSPCFCPQEVRLIAGFDCKLWGYWPTSAFAPTWDSTTVEGVDLISAFQSKYDHGYITPFAVYGLVKAGSATLDMQLDVENPAGMDMYESTIKPYKVSKYLPEYHTKKYDELKNVSAGSDIQATAYVKTLS